MSTYRGCSLFINNFQLPASVEYTPPEIALNLAQYKNGAMDTPVPVDRGMQPLTARYKIAGMDPTAFLFLGLVPGFRARLTVHRLFRWGERLVLLHDEMEGFISAIRPDGHNDDKVSVGQEMTLSVSYYRVSVEGVQPLLEVIPAMGIRRQFGVDPQRLSTRLTELLQ
jgi:phage tail tube protein FII